MRIVHNRTCSDIFVFDSRPSPQKGKGKTAAKNPRADPNRVKRELFETEYDGASSGSEADYMDNGVGE